VIFATYSSLIGESRAAGSNQHTSGARDGKAERRRHIYDTRLRQLLQWCGKDFDGLVNNYSC
jgi:hypothetical protein